jgi:hypothetical protein
MNRSYTKPDALWILTLGIFVVLSRCFGADSVGKGAKK